MLEILCLIFFISLFGGIFLKIRNLIIVKELKCKELYKEIKKNSRSRTFARMVFIISRDILIVFGIYIAIGVLLAIFLLFMIFITLGGIAYVDTGADPTFYNKSMEFGGLYLKLLEYFAYALFMSIYALVIQNFYINVLDYKSLKKHIENSEVKHKNINSTKNNIKAIGTMVLIVVVFFSITSLIQVYQDSKPINLAGINRSSYSDYTPNWYFFYKDRLYTYDIGRGESFYSVNLKATDKQELLASNTFDDPILQNLSYPHFFMVYNNEAYYYTAYNRGIKRINLSSAEISNVVNDKYYYLIGDTLNNGKVLVTYENNHKDNSHTYFAYLNLENGEITDEMTLKFMGSSYYYYDTENEKAYCIVNNKDNGNSIYENNNIIYSYELEQDRSLNNYDIVFVKDNYIFAITGRKLLKIKLSDYSIIDEKVLDKSYSLIKSTRDRVSNVLRIGEESPTDVALYPFFTAIDDGNEKLYKFNSSTMTFEEIISKDFESGFIQKYQDIYIIQSNKKTIVYNEKLEKYKIYDSVNYSIDNNNLYMMTYTGDFYNKIKLNYKILKLVIDDIFI